MSWIAVMIHLSRVKYYVIPQKTPTAGYQNVMSAEKGKRSVAKIKMDSQTIYKQWKTILVLANCKGIQNDENVEPQKFFQKL